MSLESSPNFLDSLVSFASARQFALFMRAELSLGAVMMSVASNTLSMESHRTEHCTIK